MSRHRSKSRDTDRRPRVAIDKAREPVDEFADPDCETCGGSGYKGDEPCPTCMWVWL